MSELQAVLFPKKNFNTTQARKWLKDNDLKQLKRVDKTEHLLRYRITEPKKYKSFITKKIKKGILLVIGFKHN